MATNITVRDETTGRTKTIVLDTERGVLTTQPYGNETLYVKLTTDARTVGGSTINPFVIEGDSDLVLGSTRYDEVTTDAYENLDAAISDYITRMTKGDPSDSSTAMDFSA